MLSRRVLNASLELCEHHRYMKGLFAWIGFPSVAVMYRRDPRFADVTKWNYWAFWNLALEGFTSSTIAPLKTATYLGFGIAGLAFIYAIFTIYKTVVYGDPASG